MKKIVVNLTLLFFFQAFFSACQSDNVLMPDYDHSKGYQETKSTLETCPIAADFYITQDIVEDEIAYRYTLWGNGNNDSLHFKLISDDVSIIESSLIFPIEHEISVSVENPHTIGLDIKGVHSQLKVKEQTGGYVVLQVYREAKHLGDVALHANFTKSSFMEMSGSIKDGNAKFLPPISARMAFRAIQLIAMLHGLQNDAKCMCGGKGNLQFYVSCLLSDGIPVEKHSKDGCTFDCKEKTK